MNLKVELSDDDLERLIRSELTRRFPELRIETFYLPYFRDIDIRLTDEPEPNPVPTLAGDAAPEVSA